MTAIDYRDFDRDIWARELEDFVPRVIYDMHAHLWSEAHKGALTGPPVGLRLEVDFQGHLDWAAQLFPGREMHFLMLGTPVPGMDVEAHNTWMAGQVAGDADSAALMLVTPQMAPEYVAGQVAHHRFFGLKPYRLFAPDPVNARIRDFLPEAHIEVADHLGLAITLHLAKKTGPADPENLADLRQYTRRYPRVQWVLAHCARAFNCFMLEEAIRALCDLPNIWYDTSAINDLYSHYLLVKHEDRGRVMFGSDDVAAGCMRGKYITYGRAWLGFQGQADLPHCDPTAIFVIYEQLRQERQVAQMLGLSQQEIEDHFSGNARRFRAQVLGQQKG